MAEPEIYKPDLDLIKRIDADIFFIKRSHEFEKKIAEVKLEQRDLLWFAYGLLLKYGSELSKVVAIMKARAMPGWIIALVNGLAWIIGWQSKRLKQ